MYAGRTVKAFTPYGRWVTVSILLPYMVREHAAGVLDEWMLFMNTDDHGQEDDIAQAENMAAHYPWIKLYPRPETDERHQHKQMYTKLFYRYCTDPDTVYLRFDDDIVYVHENTIRSMVEQKTARPGTLGLFPIIWNNAICSWHLQQRGNIPNDVASGWPTVGQPYCMDPVGWADGGLAVRMHELLLERIATGRVAECFMYQDVQLAPQQQFSVSCFAVDGRDYIALPEPGVLDFYEEEHWLTVHRPGVTGQVNQILADALVSHFSFYPQRGALFATNLLDRYRSLAMDLENENARRVMA